MKFAANLKPRAWPSGGKSLPERVLARCISRIKRESKASQQGDMLAISEVMTSLRFPNSELLALFSGEKKMILDTPVTRKWKAWGAHELIVDTLQERFGKLPEDVDALIRTIVEEKKLKRLNRTANKCADLDAFRKVLTA
jgi:hypothetical protein